MGKSHIIRMVKLRAKNKALRDQQIAEDKKREIIKAVECSLP